MLLSYTNGVTTITLIDTVSTYDGDIILSGSIKVNNDPSIPEAKWSAIRSFNRWAWVVVIEPPKELEQKPLIFKLWRPGKLVIEVNRRYWMQLLLWDEI